MKVASRAVTREYLRDGFRNADPEQRAEILMQILEFGGVVLNKDGALLTVHTPEEIWIRSVSFSADTSGEQIQSFIEDVDYNAQHAARNEDNEHAFHAFWDFLDMSTAWSKHVNRGRMLIELSIPNKAKGSISEWQEILKVDLQGQPEYRDIQISCPALEEFRFHQAHKEMV